jgi:hypothetical protein
MNQFWFQVYKNYAESCSTLQIFFYICLQIGAVTIGQMTFGQMTIGQKMKGFTSVTWACFMVRHRSLYYLKLYSRNCCCIVIQELTRAGPLTGLHSNGRVLANIRVGWK